MSTLNLGLQSAGLMRRNVDDEMEMVINECNKCELQQNIIHLRNVSTVHSSIEPVKIPLSDIVL